MILYLLISIPFTYFVLIKNIFINEKINIKRLIIIGFISILFYITIFFYKRFNITSNYFSWNIIGLLKYFIHTIETISFIVMYIIWLILSYFIYRKNSQNTVIKFIDFITYFASWLFISSCFDILLIDRTYAIQELLLYPTSRIITLIIITVIHSKIVKKIPPIYKLFYIILPFAIPFFHSFYFSIIHYINIINIGTTVYILIMLSLIYTILNYDFFEFKR